MKKVIAVFDIGKTNKKFLLFDQNLSIVYQDEKKVADTVDEDGFECDDIEFLERWVCDQLSREITKGEYDIVGVNFSTFGASLVFLDKQGKRLTPLYNYLKPVPDDVHRHLYETYGGKEEFCRKTASPALDGMLNSGVQILWLKQYRSNIFKKVKHILHLPQYLSFLFTQKVLSEYTSIGCHTAMWDFDNMRYHEWLSKEGVTLPDPVSNSYVQHVNIAGKHIGVGCGIHDSSSSLAPYILGSREKFVLISTGTWCISMNPYNYSSLTSEELAQDCLCYLSVDEKPVKSSRLFMGHIHDVNAERLEKYFNKEKDAYQKVDADEELIRTFLRNDSSENAFFKNGIPENYVDETVDLSKFSSFEVAYNRMMYDLTKLSVSSIELVSPQNDDVKNIYISGGFSRNKIYTRLLANFFPGKSVYTSEIDNATALGAAMIIGDLFETGEKPAVNLNLKEWKGF